MPHAVLQTSTISFYLTIAEELRLDPRGVLGRELSDELALNSSELRFSDPSPSPSLSPLLMELLSSQLKQDRMTIKETCGKQQEYKCTVLKRAELYLKGKNG